MSLESRLSDEIKAAMRNRDQVRLEALRALRGDILKEQKSGSESAVTDAMVIQFAKAQIKQRRDAITQFRNGGRPELAVAEEAIVAVIQEFLPQAVSAEKLHALIDSACQGLETPTSKDMGKVIAAVREQVTALGLDVDGRELAAAVKAKLG